MNINFGNVKTAEMKAEETATSHAASVKAEVESRIFSVIDQNAQTSLLAAVVANRFGAADMTTFKEGQQWIEDTKAEGRRAATEGDDPVWPEIPEGVVELAKRF